MAQFIRFFSKQLARFTPAPILFRMKVPVILPFYHTVSNHSLPHILNYPYRNEMEFENELDELQKHFTPVSLEELYKNPHSDKKIFHLSFDDGLRECSEVIAPILLRKGIPATFFINSGFVDNKALFHRYKASLLHTHLQKFPDAQAEMLLKKHGINRKNLLGVHHSLTGIIDEAAVLMELDFNDFLNKHQPYMSTTEVLKLHEQGFSIGGHSHEHAEFWTLKTKKQFKQVVKSMDWVKKNIKPKIKAFSFPYTDDGVKAKLFKILHEENVCDITFGTAGLKYDNMPNHFQRIPMEQKYSFKPFLKGEFLYFRIRKLLGQATVKH